MPASDAAQSWRPTHAHVRATIAGTALLIGGVAAGRPDVALLAVPLACVAVWAGLRRPRREPRIEAPAAALTVHEGEDFGWTAVVADLEPGARVVAAHPAQRFLEVDPRGGVVQISEGDPAKVRVGLRAMRWGRRTLGDPAVAVYDRWYGWRWGPSSFRGIQLTVLPVQARAAAHAPAPHPHGLVGMERAARVGEGGEFEKVRPFAPGDRLRRIHWPVSARTGRLHVTATHADEDAQVMLLVDALNDIGDSAGLDGEPSSMDITVRAVAAVAEQFLHRGDRVGMRVFGDWRVSLLAPRSGEVQLRRIVDSLCLIEPGSARGVAPVASRRGIGVGTLVLMFSPMIEPEVAAQVAVMLRSGLDVVVVDTLPPHTIRTSPALDPATLAWRMRMIERRVELDRLSTLGVPAVRWSGPHSLDIVLRDLSLRPMRPRLVAR
ncbi:MAG: DUF58 domain-containing protein [Marmoricola sp.]